MSETAGLSAPARALAPTAAYWAAMFAASALGTNLGDYWADALGLGLPASLASLAVFSVALIAADRLWGRGMEIFFWIALVVLRAMATNIGDSLSDDMGLARTITAPALAVLTLAAGWLTVGERSPLVDARYWIAMALGGAFGTVAGDLTSHTVGLPVASVALTALLVVGVAGRSTMAGASILSYWASC